MSGPILARLRDVPKLLLWDLPGMAMKAAWCAVTGRRHTCPYIARKRCRYASGGDCGLPPWAECPK